MVHFCAESCPAAAEAHDCCPAVLEGGQVCNIDTFRIPFCMSSATVLEVCHAHQFVATALLEQNKDWSSLRH
jgi:hypothetical protein